MPRIPILIFIFNLILFASCNDADEPAKEIPKDPKIEESLDESLNIEVGSKINGQDLTLNSSNSEAVNFGDMYDIKLKLEPQGAQRNDIYEVRIYIVVNPGAQKYSIQNFSPSRKQVAIGLSCIAEIIYKDTIYYGYEGSVNLVDHRNGKMDLSVQIKAESLNGLPLELDAGILDLKITPFNSQDCYVDKVISQMTYTGNTVIARYYYTSEGKLKYVHFGSEQAGEAFYFSYLNGTVKEFWYSMTTPQDGLHKVMRSGIVHINSSNRIESMDVMHFYSQSSNDTTSEVQNFYYNETGQLQKVESRFENNPIPSITEFKYSGKNVIERKWVSSAGPAILTLENYDNKSGPSRRIHNSVHENFFFISLFKFDAVYLSLSENNFGYMKNNVWGHLEEASYTYNYDALGNTVEIKWNSLKGYKISYKYCGF